MRELELTEGQARQLLGLTLRAATEMTREVIKTLDLMIHEQEISSQARTLDQDIEEGAVSWPTREEESAWRKGRLYGLRQALGEFKKLAPKEWT